MKTIKQIDTLIAEEEYHAKNVRDEKLKNKSRRKIGFYRIVRMYLEIDPSEEYVRRVYHSLKERIDRAEDDFFTWKDSSPEVREMTLKEAKREFNKEFRINTLKKQFSAVTFVLS